MEFNLQKVCIFSDNLRKEILYIRLPSNRLKEEIYSITESIVLSVIQNKCKKVKEE